MSNERKDNQMQPTQQVAPDKKAKSKEDLRAAELLRRAEEKERDKAAKIKEKRKQGKENGAKKFVDDSISELKASTWPTKTELLRWCLIVLATVGIVAAFAAVIDNFIATPLMYGVSALEFGNDTMGIFDIAMVVAFFASGLGAIAGVMLHQGGETEGLSDTVASKLTGGSGQAQKNLDRITLVCIVLFVICLLVMMIAFPQGTIAQA